MIPGALRVVSVALALAGLAQMAFTETDPTVAGLAAVVCILGAMIVDW